MGEYGNYPNFLDRHAFANSVDPDQTVSNSAPLEHTLDTKTTCVQIFRIFMVNAKTRTNGISRSTKLCHLMISERQKLS